MAHLSGNVTGLTIGQVEVVSQKRLQLLKEALPGISQVAVVWDVKRTKAGADPVEAAARSLRLQLLQLDVASVDDFQRVFRAAKQGRAGAVMLIESPRAVVNRNFIGELALKHRLPVMSEFSRLVEAGG